MSLLNNLLGNLQTNSVDNTSGLKNLINNGANLIAEIFSFASSILDEVLTSDTYNKIETDYLAAQEYLQNTTNDFGTNTYFNTQNTNYQNYTYSNQKSTLSNTYNLNGKNYSSLLSQSELNDFASNIRKGGNGNKWGYPDKCLSFAYAYGAWINGPSNSEMNGASSSKYLDAGRYSDYSGSKEEVLAKVKSELDAGRPVVLQVNGNKNGTSRHYVTVVGYNQNSNGSLSESDLLILDTYDGKVEGMGDNGARFMISGEATGRDYGYQIYIQNN